MSIQYVTLIVETVAGKTIRVRRTNVKAKEAVNLFRKYPQAYPNYRHVFYSSRLR